VDEMSVTLSHCWHALAGWSSWSAVYHMCTTIELPVPGRVKLTFVIFNIRALWRSVVSVRVPGCQKLQMTGLTPSGTGCSISVHIW